MPIDFREKQVGEHTPTFAPALQLTNSSTQPQRGDAETIIGALKMHPDGLHSQSFLLYLVFLSLLKVTNLSLW